MGRKLRPGWWLPGIGRKLPGWRWFAAAIGLAWALCLLALGIGLLVPGVTWDGSLQPAVDARFLSPEDLELLQSTAANASLPPVVLLGLAGLLSGVTMSFAVGCGEEIGWRGLVHAELRPLGFWRNALVTGGLWALWHMPLVALGYGFPVHPGLGAALLGASCLVSSVGYAYVRERSGSTLAVGLFHGATEGALLVAVAPVSGGSELTVGMASVTWIAADVLLVAGLLAFGRFVAGTGVNPLTGKRRQPASVVQR